MRDGFDPRVDELRALSPNSKDVIARARGARARAHRDQLAQGALTRASSATTSRSRSRDLGKVPSDYRRKQTVANGERFTTDELEELRAKIVNADERLRALEAELFEALRSRDRRAARHACASCGHALAELDVHARSPRSRTATTTCGPTSTTRCALELRRRPPPGGRARWPRPGSFVPNDVRARSAKRRG